MPGGNGTEAELPKTLQAGTTAVAADVMENLEKLLAALNGGLGLVNFEAPIAGVVTATEDKALSSSYQDIPGTERTIDVDVKGLLIVKADFVLALNPLGTHLIVQGFGRINVNGVDTGQIAEARHDPDPDRANETAQFAVPARIEVPLEPGEHKIKLRARHDGGGDEADAKMNGTGYDYMVYAR